MINAWIKNTITSLETWTFEKEDCDMSEEYMTNILNRYFWRCKNECIERKREREIPKDRWLWKMHVQAVEDGELGARNWEYRAQSESKSLYGKVLDQVER